MNLVTLVQRMRWVSLTFVLVMSPLSLLAKVSKCLEVINQQEAYEANILSESDIATISLNRSGVLIALKQGNWAEPEPPGAGANSNTSSKPRVENAHSLREQFIVLLDNAEFRNVLSQPDGYVEIDLSAVNRISTDLVGTFLTIKKQLKLIDTRNTNFSAKEDQNLERLRFTGVQPDVYSLIEMMRMHGVLGISDPSVKSP